MASPQIYEFVPENPGDGNSDSSDTDESHCDDSDDDDDETETELPVRDLLSRVLDRIKEGQLDLTDEDEYEKFTSGDGKSLTRDTGDEKCPTALHLLAAKEQQDLPGDRDKLQPLISVLVKLRNDLLTMTDHAGLTPLSLAISEQKSDMVQWMCEAYTTIDDILTIKNYQSANCIHIAIDKDFSLVDFLVDRAGPETLSAPGPKKKTPLHLAVEYARCSKENFATIEKMFSKCEGLMKQKERESDVSAEGIESPYRYHIKSCEEAEAKKREKFEKKGKKGKKGKNRSRDGEQRRKPQEKQNMTGGSGGKETMPQQPQFIMPSLMAPHGRQSAPDNRKSGLNRDAMLGKNSSAGKYGKPQPRATNESLVNELVQEIAQPTPDIVPEKASDKTRSGQKESFKRTKLSSKTSSKKVSYEVTWESVKDITNFLRLHYLRSRSENVALEILYGPNGSANQQINFDLFSFRTVDFDIIKTNIGFLSFDDMLQYIAIPKIERGPAPITANSKRPRMPSKPDGDGRDEMVQVFDLLRKKNVKVILQLIVDDLDEPSHSDEAIEYALGTDKTGIEIWDWKKYDLCSEVIKKTAPQARVVNLYWAGNHAVLRSWSDERGLKQLKGLKRVYLHVRQGLEKYARVKQNVNEFCTAMRQLCPAVSVEPKMPGPTQKTSYTSRSDPEGDDCTSAHKDEWMQTMSEFGKMIRDAEMIASSDFENGFAKTEEPIKVALIDDGINVNEIKGFCLAGGRSYCPKDDENDRNHPFYISSTGHGTIMAKQIYRICPRAKLHVFKLEDHGSDSTNHQINARSAVQAIREAIREKVHIISMSWTIDDTEDDTQKKALENTIQDAANKNILMFCSASDTGAVQTSSLPSKATTKIFKIGAAQASGTSHPFVGNPNVVDFIFPGDKVALGKVGGSKPTEVTGSSVATALAAGLAALILYCAQIRVLLNKKEAKARDDFAKLKRHENMVKAFKTVGTTEESNHKYLAVWETFGKAVGKTKDEGYDQDTWINIVADVGRDLCVKF